jgi:hypothetical protein
MQYFSENTMSAENYALQLTKTYVHITKVIQRISKFYINSNCYITIPKNKLYVEEEFYLQIADNFVECNGSHAEVLDEGLHMKTIDTV